MIYFIIVLSLIFYIYGIYRAFMFLFKLPSMRAYKIAGRLSKINKKTSLSDVFINSLTAIVAKHIKISEEREIKLKSYLRYYDECVTARSFVAEQLTRSAILCVVGLILYIVFPIASVAIFLMVIIYYFNSYSRLEENYNIKREEIEHELPRFCSTVAQEIKISHDILGIMERYSDTANRAFKKELEIVIADMKSSNYEAALVRFESRLSIGSVSDIVRGLIGVIRGDDMKSYFEMLSHDLDATELQALEDRAAKQPAKMKKYQFFILVAMVLMYIVTISVYLLKMNKPAYL